MKKMFAMMVALMTTMFTVSAMAFTPPPSPAPKSWISDTSHVLSDAAHQRLDTKLRQINQSSANEVAALIVPTLDGDTVEDVGDLTTKAWGVGKKDLDNGVLVVIAMKEHKTRISTGKGVEGDLPDLKANDILQSARPYLRKGDVEGALGFIFDSAASQMANHKAEAQQAAAKNAANPTQPSTATTSQAVSSGNRQGSSCAVSQPGADNSSSGGLIFLLLAGVAFVAIWLVARSSRRKRDAQLQEEQELQEHLARVRDDNERAARLAREHAERTRVEAQRRSEEIRLNAERVRQSHMDIPTPVVAVPSVMPPRPIVHHNVAPIRPVSPVAPVAPVAAVATVVAATLLAEEAERAQRTRDREAEEANRRKREREREDEDRQARAREAREREDSERRARQAREDQERRDREDEDRRRRDEESRSSYSSSTSYGSDSSSSDSGSSYGGGGDSGGFGGGDSGGGGSSSDW